MPYPFFQGYQNYNNQMYYQNMQQNPPQIQNTGFILVKDIKEAMTYPVAPGNSVTFKDENGPYIYTKTLGFSQLDQPIFETFKLVKEDKTVETTIEEPEANYLSIDEANNIKAEIDKLKADIIFLKECIGDVKESDT